MENYTDNEAILESGLQCMFGAEIITTKITLSLEDPFNALDSSENGSSCFPARMHRDLYLHKVLENQFRHTDFAQHTMPHMHISSELE